MFIVEETELQQVVGHLANLLQEVVLLAEQLVSLYQ